MKKHYSLLKLIAITALGFTTPSCTTLDLDKMDEVNYGTSLCLPIGNVKANVLEIVGMLDEEMIQTDTTNNTIMLYWQKKNHVYEFDFKSFSSGMTIQNGINLKETDGLKQIFDKIPSSINKIPFPEGKYPFTYNSTYKFGYNEEIEGQKIYRIDSAVVNSSNLDLKINVEGLELTKDNYLEMTILFPFFTENKSNDIKIRITKNDYNFTKAMSDFSIKFADSDNSTQMQILCEYVCNNPTTLQRNAKINFSTTFNIIDCKEVYGYFWQNGPLTADKIVEELPSDLFNNPLLTNNKLLFSNPEINLTVKNKLNIPIKFKVDSVYAIDINNDKHYADFNGSTTKTVDILRPEFAGETTTTNISFNRDNGATNRLFESTPKKIHYMWEVFIPKSPDTDKHFLVTPLEIKLDIEAKMPFEFDPTSEFAFRDTIDADLSSGNFEQLKDISIETLNIHLDIDNSLPIMLKGKAIFLDKDGKEIYSNNDLVIKSADVDDKGLSTKSNIENIILNFEGEGINNILNTKSIIIVAKVTGRDELSKIYFQATDELKVNLNAFVKAKTKIEL